MRLAPPVALVMPSMPTPPTGHGALTSPFRIHGACDGNNALADATCPSLVTRTALPAACHTVTPLATAIAATAMEHAGYGDVPPSTDSAAAALCG